MPTTQGARNSLSVKTMHDPCMVRMVGMVHALTRAPRAVRMVRMVGEEVVQVTRRLCLGGPNGERCVVVTGRGHPRDGFSVRAANPALPFSHCVRVLI